MALQTLRKSLVDTIFSNSFYKFEKKWMQYRNKIVDSKIAAAQRLFEDEHGCTFIMLCVRSSRHAILEYLLENNYWWDEPCMSGIMTGSDGRKAIIDVDRPEPTTLRSPLHEACENGDFDSIKLLVEIGNACLNSTDASGDTPLYLAVQKHHTECARYLIKKGAVVHHAVAEYACMHGDGFMMRALIFPYEDELCPSENVIKTLSAPEMLLPSFNVDEWVDGKGQSLLHISVLHKKYDIVNFLITKFPCLLQVCDSDGYNALHVCASEGIEFVVPMLIERGCDLDARVSHNGYTATYIAAAMGHIDVLRLLIKYGADINIPANDRSSPLIVASENGKYHAVVELIKSGRCDVDIVSDIKMETDDDFGGGTTALGEAASRGYDNIASILVPLSKNSINHAHCMTGQTPLLYAISRGHTEVVRVLLTNPAVDVNHPDLSGNTALITAAHISNQEMILLLCEKDVNIDSFNQDGMNPLLTAARLGYEHVVQVLLEHKADPNARDPTNMTPLHYACRGGYADIAELLLNHGAQLAIFDEDGHSPVHYCLFGGQVPVLKPIFQYFEKMKLDHSEYKKATSDNPDGSKRGSGQGFRRSSFTSRSPANTPSIINTDSSHSSSLKRDSQESPRVAAVPKLFAYCGIDVKQDPDIWHGILMASCMNGALYVTEQLIDREMLNPNFTNDQGRTPMHFAVESGNVFVIQALFKRGALLTKFDNSRVSPLILAMRMCNYEVFDYILRLGAKPSDAVGEESEGTWTSLHEAAQRGYAESMMILLKYWENYINCTDYNGRTPLILATQENKMDIVMILQSAQANPNIYDADGLTALHYSTMLGRSDIAKTLLLGWSDLNPDLTDLKRRRTPLLYAVKLGHEEIVKFLIQRKADPLITDMDESSPITSSTTGPIKQMISEYIARLYGTGDVERMIAPSRGMDGETSEISEVYLAPTSLTERLAALTTSRVFTSSKPS